MRFICLFNLCLFGFAFPLPLSVWIGLRSVIVALPGLFSYPFFGLKLDSTELNSKAKGQTGD